MANFYTLSMVYSDREEQVMVYDDKTGLKRPARFKHKTAAIEASLILQKRETACHFSHCAIQDCTTGE